MKNPSNSRKIKPSFEINWKIREIFSEVALANFSDDIENKYLAIEKVNNRSINS